MNGKVERFCITRIGSGKKLDERGNENIIGIYGIFQDCNYP